MATLRKKAGWSRKAAGRSTVGADVGNRLRELKDLVTFLRKVESAESYRRILARLGVMEALTESQRDDLSLAVADLYATDTSAKWLASETKLRAAWAKDGHRRIHKLKTKLARVVAALKDVRDYIDDIGIATSPTTDDALNEAEAVLDPQALKHSEVLVASLSEAEPPVDAMLTLHELFVSYGLKNNEAEVRVAKIGNHLWDWNVQVTERYSGRENWKGCPAVRKAVRRRRATDKRTSSF
jgi:hypothetical protein